MPLICLDVPSGLLLEADADGVKAVHDTIVAEAASTHEREASAESSPGETCTLLAHAKNEQ